ncbi:hypothetical protein L228DRAFT_285080 [Xylona heveae TC161]|uniref:Spindle pole body component n=1 Tax=Xylona heveae (strain CBS 132557 / TC161) TaxID=1328760 RepID=A0A165AEZ3_XYLHT|nr:hypothetical protein L228DRAFT_285080 [Xylona heveae TC161]KZF20367.1 hypothetical protein L228DRAFT_285080 [Xylona heveae TC161]
MAHLAKLGLLTDELITALTGITEQNDPQNFRLCRKFAARSLKHHNYGRTNQFEVAQRLDGLQEKLSILNCDELADAIEDRRNEDTLLRYNWAPEALSLILELSNKPATNSRLEDLEALKPPPSPPPLTWEDIISEDPLDEEGIWDEVDFGAESSEDEEFERRSFDRSVSGDETQPSSVAAEENEAQNLEVTLLQPDQSILDHISKAQFWNHRTRPAKEDVDLIETAIDLSKTWKLSEMQALREVLFMLSGLPTSLFSCDTSTGVIKPVEKYALGHTSYDSFQGLLAAFANLGTQVQTVRQWTSLEQSIPLLQSLNASISSRLKILQQKLLQIESRFVHLRKQVVVSLVDVYHRVQTPLLPLLMLADLLPALKETAGENPFKCLEKLFHQTSLVHLAGDDVSFPFMTSLFLDCFNTYLRPIRAWMESGELYYNEEIFFIGMAEKSVENRNLWHDQYFLRQDHRGRLHAPEFLRAQAKKILNTGKSVVFLRRLGIFGSRPAALEDEPYLDYAAVCGTDNSIPLAPFSDLFDEAFERWLDSKHHSASTVLRNVLFSRYGLFTILDALEHIYFLKDGSLYANMLTVLFEKIERRKDSWNDRFLLTEQAQGALGTLACMDPKRLFVRSTPLAGEGAETGGTHRSLKMLGTIKVEYTLPWSIANIIARHTITDSYQRVFTLLVQIRNAKYLLERRRLLKTDFIKPNHASADSNYDVNLLSLSIRHRLLWLVNTLYSYLTETVIVTSTLELRYDMNAAKDVDAMISAHEHFAVKLQEQCLLSRKLSPIYQALMSLLDLAFHFSDLHSASEVDRSVDRSVLSGSRHDQALRDKQYAGRAMKRPTARLDFDSSDDEEADDSSEYDELDPRGSKGSGARSSLPSNRVPLAARLREMRAEIDRLCGFAATGLRSVSRAGGEPAWDMLADMLDWGIRPTEEHL